MVPEQSVQPEAGSSPGGGPSRVTGMAQGLEIGQFVFAGAVGLHAVVWDLRKVTSTAGQQVRDQAVFCPCQLNTPNMKGKIS